MKANYTKFLLLALVLFLSSCSTIKSAKEASEAKAIAEKVLENIE